MLYYIYGILNLVGFHCIPKPCISLRNLCLWLAALERKNEKPLSFCNQELSSLPNHLKSLLGGMRILGKLDLDFYKFTPEQVREIGQIYLSALSPKKQIGFKPERLAELSVSEIEELEKRIKKLKPECNEF